MGGSAAWTASPTRAPWLAAALFAALALTAWGVARPRVPAGDEPHYLVITQSLLRDGDLRIDNNHRAEHYLAYYDAVLKPDFMRRGTDRQIYSIHAPGVSALVLPAFAVAGYPGAVVTVVAVGALGMAALWTLVFQLTASAGAAWIGWAAVATSAPVLLHAFTIYPDPVGGALAIVAVAALAALDTPAAMVSGRRWLGVGAALALLPWLHTRFALIAGALGLAIVLRLWRQPARRGDLLRFVSVPTASGPGVVRLLRRHLRHAESRGALRHASRGGLVVHPGRCDRSALRVSSSACSRRRPCSSRVWPGSSCWRVNAAVSRWRSSR